MTLRQRVYAAIALVVTLILITVVMVASVFPQLLRTSDDVRSRLLPVTNSAIDLRVVEADLLRTMRTVAFDGDPAGIAQHRRLRGEAREDIDQLRAHVGVDPGVQEAYDDLLRHHEEFTDIADRVIQLRTQGDLEGALQLAFSTDTSVAFLRLARASEDVRDGLIAVRDAEVEELDSRLVRLGSTLISVAVILIVLTVLLYITTTNWVLEPLDRLREELREAAGGDHEAAITPAGPREIADVGRDAEHLRRRLLAGIDEARAAREALGQDAPGVAAIRRELFPDLPDPSVPGLQVHGLLQPAQGVLAGDWWDTVYLGEGRLAVCVADVAGHGPRSGIAALRIKHIVNLVLGLGGTPSQAMRRIAETFEDEQSLFATAVILTIDGQNGEARWCNAGHVPPLVVTARGQQSVLHPTGPLLSTLGGEWRTAEFTLEPGDTVLIPTDGIVEARDEHGEIVGDEGFAKVERASRKASDGSVGDLVARIISTVRGRSVDWGRDDATLVGVRRVQIERPPAWLDL